MTARTRLVALATYVVVLGSAASLNGQGRAQMPRADGPCFDIESQCEYWLNVHCPPGYFAWCDANTFTCLDQYMAVCFLP